MISLANFTVSLGLVVEQLTRIGDQLERIASAQEEREREREQSSPSPPVQVSKAKITFIDPANPPRPRAR